MKSSFVYAMHQYFTTEPLSVGEDYLFTKEQAHHVRDVLKMDHEKIRLVYNGRGYFAYTDFDGKKPLAHVAEEDSAVNELPLQLTLCMALIRREKMELVLQKAAELGVARIVPFESSRCVVHRRNDKKQRWDAIVLEASQQCKRNRVPVVEETAVLEELATYKSDISLAAYENAFGTALPIHSVLEQKNPASVTVVIGPEGGFSEEEMNWFEQNGFESVTLGNRILRAETAAFYALSVVGEWSMHQ